MSRLTQTPANAAYARVAVRPRARVEPETSRQVDALFAADWDDDTVLVTHEPVRPGARAGLSIAPRESWRRALIG